MTERNIVVERHLYTTDFGEIDVDAMVERLRGTGQQDIAALLLHLSADALELASIRRAELAAKLDAEAWEKDPDY